MSFHSFDLNKVHSLIINNTIPSHTGDLLTDEFYFTHHSKALSIPPVPRGFSFGPAELFCLGNEPVQNFTVSCLQTKYKT